MWERVRAELAAGRQAYVVCPLVEESEKLEVASATETFELLQATELDGFRVGLLHGRVKADEKEATMAAFRAGELDVLVATTVIEVGVDVPNATVMVILDADRFGIAQLHQLRGRVGPGRARVGLLPGGRGGHRRRRGPARGAGAHHRRLRAGRGRPRPPGRGHHHGRAPEGPERPQAGVAAHATASGSGTPATPRSTWSTARGRARRRCSTSSGSSSTRTTQEFLLKG